MYFSSSLFGLVALATLALATSHVNFRDVISDLNALRDKVVSPGNHVHNVDLLVRHNVFDMISRS